MSQKEMVSHPAHYNEHKSGVECIDVAERIGFNVGNSLKYVWRAGLKTENKKEDLQKALWYAKRAESKCYSHPLEDTKYDAMLEQNLLKIMNSEATETSLKRVATAIFHCNTNANDQRIAKHYRDAAWKKYILSLEKDIANCG